MCGLMICHCVEMRDNQRDECEKRLKGLEELIRCEELQVEAMQSACGEFHWLTLCAQRSQAVAAVYK